MPKVLISVFMLFVVCGLAALSVSTQTTAFTYQGSLNNGGTAANGNFDFEFAMFDSLAGGSQVGATLTRSAVAVTNGIFAVSLDFDGQFPGSNRFLEIRVRQTGGGAFTPLSPRQAVGSSPYSIRSLSTATADVAASAATANNALQLGGIAANQYVITSDARLSDSRNPLAGSSSYIQNQSATAQASSSFNISGSGIVGGLLSANSFTSASFVNANTNYTILGNRVLSIAGTENFFAGIGTGQTNTGISNSFFGHSAGLANTTGSQNSFFGRSAGRSNTTANVNSFFGESAGTSNNTGVLNSFFGAQAGFTNSVGDDNAFFGGAAGFGSLGSGNTFLGAFAGNSNSTGANNTSVGANSGVLSGTLTNATAIGSRAAVSQNNSLVLGSISGVNGSNADTNVGIGTTAPTNLLTIGTPEATVVNGRVGIFSPAGTNLIMRETTAEVEGVMGVNSSNGVIYGSMTSHNVNLRTNNTNRVTIDTNGNVGVGTSGPLAKLHVSGASSDSATPIAIVQSSGSQIPLSFRTGSSELARIRANNSGDGNLLLETIGNTADISFIAGGGSGVDAFIDGGTGNVGVGTTSPSARLQVADTSTSASTPIAVIQSFGTDAPLSFIVGAAEVARIRVNDFGNLVIATTGGSEKDIFFRAGSDTGGADMFIDGGSGNVGVGTTAPDQKFSVNGNASKTGGGSWLTFSDERLKNIKGRFTPGLAAVMQLQPLRYGYKADNRLGLRAEGEHIGFSAQAVEKIIPEAVTKNAQGYRLVNNDPIMWTMLNAVKEQQAEIVSQQKQIDEQNIEIKGLKAALCQIKPKLAICRGGRK